jgi:hypothetical protein
MSGSGGVSVVDKGGVGGGVVALDEGLALLGWQAERAIAITGASRMWAVFMTPSFRFLLLAGGTKARFPSRSGGNLKEGGNA